MLTKFPDYQDNLGNRRATIDTAVSNVLRTFPSATDNRIFAEHILHQEQLSSISGITYEGIE